MFKFLAVVTAAGFIAFAAASAAAVTDLWAVDDKGESAKLKGFASKVRIFSAEEYKTLNAGLQKTYSQRVVFCNQEFMVSTGQKRWIVAQTKAKHRIVLREREPKGKHRDVC